MGANGEIKAGTGCCCHDGAVQTMETGCCCTMGAEVVGMLDHVPAKENLSETAPELIASGQETFDMEKQHRLTNSAEGLWELHKEIIDAVFTGGWHNTAHPWSSELQDFWRYPLAFATYAIPSLIMIDPEKYEEGIAYMRKSLLLFKDTPIWDEWTRLGFGPDPVSKDNIMYKGHLNLIYGLYQMVSGSSEFEQEYEDISNIITKEYNYNHEHEGYWGINCETDQYFPQCNSMGMMSMAVRDRIYGTELNEKYGRKINQFIQERMCDPDTGLIFAKYHPSHDQAEAYITGFCNSWALSMLHIYDKPHYERAFKNYKVSHVQEVFDGKGAYVKEYSYSKEPSTGMEESMGIFYATGLAKEYNDIDLWEKVSVYFRDTYGTELDEKGVMRLTKATPEDETFVSNYLFWGETHLGWEKVLAYDWKALRKSRA